MPLSFVQISDAGVTLANARPAAHTRRNHDYSRRPIDVGLHHDLTIELHGEDFSASTKLSVEDAMGLISMLSYAVREQLARQAASGARG